MLCYPSDDPFPGYSYLKIYHRDATKAHAEQLKGCSGFGRAHLWQHSGQ